MSFSKSSVKLFNRAIDDYHVLNDVDQLINNPEQDDLDVILYHKCWIDTVQWHLEDIIRNPTIDANRAIEIKRRIDASNQDRTDMVEQLDDYFHEHFRPNQKFEHARINTETPAWAIDRLSILCLKVYHMREESLRKDASVAHRKSCRSKLDILLEQSKDLSSAIDQLMLDIRSGDVEMKLYRQMKMYNDPNLNPILYNSDK